ncbi:MAG TPA: YdeI/OmpD-associated family protein, partial [Chitinophagaceae bacterium]|nr:YdeI/OmpD-associated family protein [Chitinophagaceae bacterium]
MVQFTTTIKQFDKQGEKTGWTYIEIPADIAEKLMPGNRKGFRVKGQLDSFSIKGIALLPMGGGNFILTLNADLRRGIRKKKGAMLSVKLQVDPEGYKLNEEFIACLKDDPTAKNFFDTLSGSHRNYFSKWIDSAKTEPTKIKRIAMAVNALSKKWGYPEMIR